MPNSVDNYIKFNTIHSDNIFESVKNQSLSLILPSIQFFEIFY